MIQNLKLYVLLSSPGSGPALRVKLWCRRGCYEALVPVYGGNADKIRKIRQAFSEIRPNFIGLDEEDWRSVDSLLTQFSSGKGMDPALSLSISLAAARAATQNELWRITGLKNPAFPQIAGVAVSGKDWKDFYLIPQKEKTPLSVFESLREAYNVIGHELMDKGFLAGRLQNGAWAGDVGDLGLLQFLSETARDWHFDIGLNVNASGLWDGKNYSYTKSGDSVLKKAMTVQDQMNLISAVAEHYGIHYLEDPFHREAFVYFGSLSQKLEGKVVSGRDLYDCDIGTIKRGFKVRATKDISISPRMLSTVSQLAGISEFAREKEMTISMNRYDAETEDSWLADLAVAFGARLIKLGLTGADNTSKVNRLMEIWEDAVNPVINPGIASGKPAEKSGK